MAIFGVGAYYDGEDVSQEFIKARIVGVGWTAEQAPELHQAIRTLKVGDIVYIKLAAPASRDIVVKGVGIIVDNVIRSAEDTNRLVSCGRNVRWLSTKDFRLPRPQEKNNVRRNTLYEEFHPEVQQTLLKRALGR